MNLSINGLTPSQIACQYYNKKILKRMIDSPKINFDLALFGACKFNNIYPLIFLLENGAELNIINNDGRNLLHATAMVQGPTHKTAQFLIKHGVPINAADNCGNTPLHLACVSHNFKIVELLIKYGANVNAQNSDGDTPLIYCARNGRYHMKLLRMLMKSNADLSIQNEEEKAFLDYISQSQRESALQLSST